MLNIGWTPWIEKGYFIKWEGWQLKKVSISGNNKMHPSKNPGYACGNDDCVRSSLTWWDIWWDTAVWVTFLSIYLFLSISLSIYLSIYRSFFICSITNHTAQQREQDAQLSQRDRAAGCVIVFAKSRRLELGDNILRTV